jgi:hypothetical protein
MASPLTMTTIIIQHDNNLTSHTNKLPRLKINMESLEEIIQIGSLAQYLKFNASKEDKARVAVTNNYTALLDYPYLSTKTKEYIMKYALLQGKFKIAKKIGGFNVFYWECALAHVPTDKESIGKWPRFARVMLERINTSLINNNSYLMGRGVIPVSSISHIDNLKQFVKGATSLGNIQIIQEMHDKGLRFSSVSQDCLYYLVKYGYSEKVMLLKPLLRETPNAFVETCILGDLVSAKSSTHTVDDKNSSFVLGNGFKYACKLNHVKVVEYLVNYFASKQTHSEYLIWGFNVACTRGNVTIAKMIVPLV